jgi:DNA polymerase elongation subunit (family B)
MYTDEDLDREINYIITSDTDSIFVTYEKLIDKKKSFDEILENVNNMSNEIQIFLNDTVINNLMLKHNVPIERSRLSLKNELVAKRGLYVSKKHYSNYILFKKGKLVNKIESKGLDTRRSDYAKYTKECLEKLLKLILESDKFSILKVNEFIKEKELEFLKLIDNGSKDVSRPSSFVKKIDQYKTVGQHINAMINWNKLMYNAFEKGSKGYMFKIKGIDQTIAPREVVEKYHKEFLSKGKKLEVICIPDEEVSLPKYIIPDRKKMLEFHWIDRYSNLLESVIEIKSDIMTI